MARSLDVMPGQEKDVCDERQGCVGWSFLKDLKPPGCRTRGDIIGSSIVLSEAAETLVRMEKSNQVARSPLRTLKSMALSSSTHL